MRSRVGVPSRRNTRGPVGLTGRGQGMQRFLESKALNPFIPQELGVAISNPIVFTVQSGLKPTYGYEATLLPELCNIIIEANDQKPLPPQQQ